MREVSRPLFIPRRPLIASMLSCDPERNWFRIAKASLISSTRPALTSVSAPFRMTRRLPLPARRTFASIDRTTGSRSGRWPLQGAELVEEGLLGLHLLAERKTRVAVHEYIQAA